LAVAVGREKEGEDKRRLRKAVGRIENVVGLSKKAPDRSEIFVVWRIRPHQSSAH